jgi:hypothetical protein
MRQVAHEKCATRTRDCDDPAPRASKRRFDGKIP